VSTTAQAGAAPAVEPVAAPAEPVRTLVNQTNKRLVLRSPDGMTLALAPLERRQVKLETLHRFSLDELLGRNFVAVEEPPVATENAVAVFWAGLFSAGAFAAIGAATGMDFAYLAAVVAAGAGVAFVAWRAVASGSTTRWLQWLLSLVIVVAVSAALPGAALWFGGDGDVAFDLANNGVGKGEHAGRLTLVGRLLQLVFISGAALLPGVCYFLFDRARLSTLRERFTRQIFRFDRSIQTRADVDAKYGTLLDEAYGPEDRTAAKLQPGTQVPLGLATVVMALGWVLTLLNPGLGVADTRDEFGQVLRNLFRPEQATAVFAFLGAYFFAVHTVLRGYVRGDLRPKTYTYIIVRVISVVLLAWVLETAFGPSDELYVIAFLTGIVPDTALYRLREFSRAALGSWKQLNSLFEPLPLTNLDGIDLYDRARLETEGVTNIESLAHHDLVDLMLQTRIPVPRLVDWTDQAILYLHLGIDADNADSKGRSALDRLRLHGIRTATDLEQAYAAALARDGDVEGDNVRELLDLLPPEGDGEPPRLRVILDVVRDEEWMGALRYWREASQAREATLRYPEDFQP
jgi:hypothetical protein